MDIGDGNAGSSNTFSRGDHVHPSDASKRGLTDLVVYEDGIANDYWQTGSTQIPLSSESGTTKTYQNGESNGSYRIVVDDFRGIGGMFRVNAYKYSSYTGSWSLIATTPQTAFDEIRHVEQTSGGSLVFDYKGERMPIPTQDTLAKKTDTTLTERGYSDWVCVPQLPEGV